MSILDRPVLSSPASGEDDRRPSETIERLWNRPLRQHAAFLALLLLVLLPLLGGRGLFTSDEGAAMAQAQLLADGRGWGLDVPRPDLDPDRVLRPIDLSDGETGAPLAKHPVYPLLLTPVVAVAGTTGAKLVSSAAAVLAALAAALIARRLGPGLDRPTLWAVGLASPLFFDAWIVIAHTLGAAACGFAALAAVAALDRPRGRTLAALGALMALAVLLRNEAVLLGAGLLVAGLVVSAVQRTRRGLAVGGAALAGTASAYLLDSYLTGLVASPGGPFRVDETLQSSNYALGRIVPTLQTLLMPEHGAFGLPGLLLLVAASAAVGAAVTAREHPEKRQRIVVLAGVAVAAALARLAFEPAAVPGLFVAFPAVAVGLVLLTRSQLRRPPVLLLTSAAGVFVGAVLLTQYANGGGAQWGFRYGAVAVPLITPVAVLALAEARRRFDATTAARLTVALCALSGCLAVLAIRTLDTQHRAGVQALDSVAQLVAGSERPVIVTYDRALGRMAWQSILAGEDWVLVPEGGMRPLVERLVDDGGDVVFISYEADADIEPFGATHEVVERIPAVTGSELEVLRLVAR